MKTASLFAALANLSICLCLHLHAPITLAARSGNVRALPCEKSIAPIWTHAQKMVMECKNADKARVLKSRGTLPEEVLI